MCALVELRFVKNDVQFSSARGPTVFCHSDTTNKMFLTIDIILCFERNIVIMMIMLIVLD